MHSRTMVGPGAPRFHVARGERALRRCQREPGHTPPGGSRAQAGHGERDQRQVRDLPHLEVRRYAQRPEREEEARDPGGDRGAPERSEQPVHGEGGQRVRVRGGTNPMQIAPVTGRRAGGRPPERRDPSA